MIRNLALTTVVALLAGSGFMHGLWTDRWSIPAELDPAETEARLERISMTLGDWEAHKFEMPPGQLEAAEATGYIARRYVNQLDGSSVTVLLLCGRPGPIAVHPPTVCYPSAGFQLRDEPRKLVVPGAGEFKTARFEPGDSLAGSQLRIFWSWSGDGTWTTPWSTRLTFAPFPILYKLYVIETDFNPSDSVGERSSADLISRLVPEINHVVFER